MKNRLLKITLLTILATTMAGMASISYADDSDTNTPAAAAPEQTAKAKFYGPITAVDTNAMTFTVNDQTFTVTTESQVTKNGKTATLADAVIGEPARGSYTKGVDGKLDVTKVRFGKKTGGKAGGKKNKNSETTETNTPSATPQNQ